MAKNAYRSIELLKQGRGATRKNTQYNRQLRKAQPSQNAQSKCLIESLRKAFLRFVSTEKTLVAIENIIVLTLRIFVESCVVSRSTGKRIKASEVGGTASIYLPLRVDRSLRASFTFLKVLIRHDGDLLLKNINRHHLIHNIHHWSLAKSLESCNHIINYAPRFPCCLFVKVDKRQCLITACEGVK